MHRQPDDVRREAQRERAEAAEFSFSHLLQADLPDPFKGKDGPVGPRVELRGPLGRGARAVGAPDADVHKRCGRLDGAVVVVSDHVSPALLTWRRNRGDGRRIGWGGRSVTSPTWIGT